MTAARACLAGVLLSACVDTTAPLAPLTLPPADGRAQTVKLGPQSFVVNRQQNGATSLRVTRLNRRDLDYSDGALAKAAAQAYCAQYNRPLDPAATGRFSLPNAWLFGGDCL